LTILNEARNARGRAQTAAPSASELREKSTWQYVAARLDEAAMGADALDVTVPLLMVLSMEGIECRPQ